MGELHWPVPGVAVILIDGTKIALAKRIGSGKWSLPCGCIESGETFVNAAIREVKEEIGIKEWIISQTEISGILLSERQTSFTQL